jgi:saccharopine dehydrogenase-like NADP-dependent oxidoreductase
MTKQCVFIAGSGGIGSAVGLLLRHFWDRDVDLILGDINEQSTVAAKQWILKGGPANGRISTCQMVDGWETNLSGCTLLLDCLPGSLAPAMARLAIKYGLHYVNLTEYVAETKEIVGFTETASTGFALQSGLAPGFVNVLGHKLFQQFCQTYGVETADVLEMRVGALTKNAVAPHFYGFTWSPIGVATEYVKQAEVVRNHKLVYVDALSGRRSLLINGRPYEEDLTSGGAADIPIRFADRVKSIDYKTLRYPGHYGWVDSILSNELEGQAKIDDLEEKMLNAIPSMEDDEVIVYCAVEGKDSNGRLRRIDQDLRVLPMTIGEVTLRAIQSTTAAGMAEAARIVVEQDHKGVLFQSQIDPDAFLNGPFVRPVYYGSGA